MAEEVHGRLTRGYGVGTEGLVGRAAHETEDDQGACLALCAEQGPGAARYLVIQISHRPASPPGNEHSGTLSREG